MSVTGDPGRRDHPVGGIEARFVRQGGRGGRFIWLMAVSMTLVALVFLGLWAVQLGPRAHHLGRTTVADAEHFTSAPSAARAAPDAQ